MLSAPSPDLGSPWYKTNQRCEEKTSLHSRNPAIPILRAADCFVASFGFSALFYCRLKKVKGECRYVSTNLILKQLQDVLAVSEAPDSRSNQNFFGRLFICYQELILEERQSTIAENRSNTLIYSSAN